MKIIDVKVFIGGLGKNYVIFKIMIDQGVYGFGDVMLNNCEILFVVYLMDYLILNFIGMDL